MTRTRLVLSAASAMYHSQAPEEITEYEAWRDADENTRAIYIKMALVAYRRLAATIEWMRVVSSGGCLCREVLHRDGVITIDDGRNACQTCGGNL